MKPHRKLTEKEKRVRIVKTARRYRKKLRYKFGKKNIHAGHGDCSAYTKHVLSKALGIKLGNSTRSQVKQGKRVPLKEAKPGDLVFFKNVTRNRRGVSHVGIVTKPGRFIGLQLYGCYERSYKKGFWASKLMQTRKIIKSNSNANLPRKPGRA